MKRVYRYCSQPSSEVACSRATGQLITTKTFTHPSYFTWLCQLQTRRGRQLSSLSQSTQHSSWWGKARREKSLQPNSSYTFWLLVYLHANGCQLHAEGFVIATILTGNNLQVFLILARVLLTFPFSSAFLMRSQDPVV